MSDSEHLLPPSATKAQEASPETIQYVQQTDHAVSLATKLFSTGTPLGHYVIRKHIGGGGMGQVYLATDEALDRDVAIKVLTQQRSSDPGIVARFMNEAKSAARLNHEHIAQVYFAGETSGIPFIAFEYVEGTNVRLMVEEHDVFPLPQALNYLLQIAHALAHAAAHGVVHRDVKPSNILITREGRAKLIDMGLARLLDTTEARGDLTASGVTLGTFDYISPEQARDPRNADIRSDIYSLGCTLFFMLAGRPPFPEGTVLQKLLQHQGDAPPDIRSFQPTIPAEIAFFIQKMMAKDPQQRFQTPIVLIDALTDVARRLGLRPAGPGNLVWTAAQSRRTSFFLKHLPWMMAVSLLIVGFFVMTLFSEWFDPVRPPAEEAGLITPIQKIVKDVPIPDQPVLPLASSFAVSFVSHPAVPSAPSAQRLEPPRIGGSLRPALSGASTLKKVSSGGVSVADIKPASQKTTAQRTNSSSKDRIVDPTGNTIGSYPSLASALTDAEGGTTIMLKWDGALRVPEPIRFDRRNLRIVAGEGSEPILLFEPTELQRSLFTVFSSDLEFQEVGIEIRLNPNVVLPRWTLFELAGNTQLTFQHCCLTIRNRSLLDNAAYHEDVVFFRNSIPAGTEEPNKVGDTPTVPLTIKLTDSLLRGEAVAIHSNVAQAIHVTCSNSLIALAKSFILIEESRRTVGQATVHIRWDTVAFFGRQEVASLITTEPIGVDCDAQQSVFVLNSSPFAVFRGLQSRKDILEKFRWSGGERGVNYYQGVTGLRFRSPSLSSSLDLGAVNDMSLEDWRGQYWTSATRDLTKIDSLTISEIGKPMSRYSPQDVHTLFAATSDVRLPNLGRLPSRLYGD